MKLKQTFAFALAAAALAGSVSACAHQPRNAVVSVHYLVTEQSPGRLEISIIEPLERILVALPRVSEVISTAGHGSVDVEIRFGGGASEQDLATVTRQVEVFALDSEIGLTSRTTRLASPRR